MSNVFSDIQRELQQEFPTFEIVWKSNSWLMRAVGWFLLVISFGKMSAFMTQYTTTIGYTVYVAEEWAMMSDVDRTLILRHERVHMRQRSKYGQVLFSLLYVLFPLPGGLAYFRMKFEREAYAETFVASQELVGDTYARSSALRDTILAQFEGPFYLWMWPLKASNRTWYRSVMVKLPRGVA